MSDQQTYPLTSTDDAWLLHDANGAGFWVRGTQMYGTLDALRTAALTASPQGEGLEAALKRAVDEQETEHDGVTTNCRVCLCIWESRPQRHQDTCWVGQAVTALASPAPNVGLEESPFFVSGPRGAA